ncbi:hypothetical protein [Arthrobacter sp. JSM 101049]
MPTIRARDRNHPAAGLVLSGHQLAMPKGKRLPGYGCAGASK